MVQQQKRQWNISASKIQRAWRSHTNSAWYRKLRTRVIIFQAHVRGYLVRRKIKDLVSKT